MIYGIVDLNLEIQDAKNTIAHLSIVLNSSGLCEVSCDWIIAKLTDKLSILEAMSNNVNFDIKTANQILMEIKLEISHAIRHLENK